MSEQRILIVEDDLHFGQQVLDLLGFLGHEPTLVASGREAVEHFREAPYDFVVSDLMLPELSGVDVVKAIRKLPGGDVVPVLMMSAVYRNPKLFERELRSLGVIEFLPKPFSIIDLGRRIGAILEAPTLTSGPSAMTESGSWSSSELRTALGESTPDFDTEGSFDRLQLVSLFVAIFEAHLAGTLTLRVGRGERTVCFLNGYPVWGDSADPSEGLGAVLAREGELPAAEVARLLRVSETTGRALREVLLKEGSLSERRLFLAERSRVRDVVVGAFAAPSGTYSFERGDDFVARVGVFEVNPVHVLSDVVQRYLPLNDVAPTVHTVGERALARGPRFRQLYPYLQLAGGLERIGGDLKQGVTVGQLMQALPQQTDGLLRVLWLMLRLGIAETRTGPSTPERLPVTRPSEGPVPVSPRTLSEPFLAAATMDDASRTVLADYLHLMQADDHALLGVAIGATHAELSAAYSERMRRYSLTRLPPTASSDVRAKAKELLVRLLDAYTKLTATTAGGQQRKGP